MGLFHFEENDNYRYGIWKIAEDEKTLKILLENEIEPPFSNPGKRIEFFSVRALAKLMGINPSTIDHRPSGRPYLLDSSTNISISHTKGYVSVLLSEDQNTGIDIEQRSDRVVKVRKKFIHPQEEANLAGMKAEEETTALLLHWSAKEAIFKAIPDEGVDFINELRIFDMQKPSLKGNFKAVALRKKTNFQIDYRVEKDFVLTICHPDTSNFQ